MWIARLFGFADLPKSLAHVLAFILVSFDRSMFETVKKVVLQAAMEEVAIRGDIGDMASGYGFRKFPDILIPEADSAARRP
ncbi:hypothetical protein D3C87_1623820 [compost metagenome]